MPKPGMRVEIVNRNGKYTIAFEGQLTREITQQLNDIAGLLGTIPNESQLSTNITNIYPTETSRFEKVKKIIQKNFSLIWFVSKDVQLIYEQELKEPIGLSTVSTYLYRMANKGLLMRTGTGNNVKYKIAPNLPQIKTKQIQNNY
ncbi:MAG: hypothetical protein LBE76_09015 [Nitrososphaerota archaeon]|nr:hypothetical protein [Nitrososphaerota archaeon]